MILQVLETQKLNNLSCIVTNIIEDYLCIRKTKKFNQGCFADFFTLFEEN